MSNIEDHIDKAIQEGKFDNLPGQGKPLNLDDNPFGDPDWRMAHHVLQSGGFTLPWIESRQEIETALENAQRELRRSWEWRNGMAADGHPPAQVDREWSRALERFREQVTEMNKKIFNYNLEVPSSQFQRLPVNFEREVAAISQGAAP
jgi:DnaJ homolog subfamily C member 28